MKKFTKFMFRVISLGAILGGAFAYLKSKGYITVSVGSEDDDYDDFSYEETENISRRYINVDTDAMKAKAKEMAGDVKSKAVELAGKAHDVAEDFADEIKEVAEDVYDEAKEKVKDASKNLANVLEKVWYEAEETVEDTVEKVEEFFNDEE